MQSWIIVSGDLVEALSSRRGLASLSPRRPVGPRTQPARVEHHRAAPRPHDDQRPRLGRDQKGCRSARNGSVSWMPTRSSRRRYPRRGPPSCRRSRAGSSWLPAAPPTPCSSARPRVRLPRVSVRCASRRDGTRRRSGAPFIPATLTLSREAGAAPTLVVDGSDSGPVRLHSAFTGISAGELRGLSASEPALCLRRSSDDLTIHLRLAAGARRCPRRARGRGGSAPPRPSRIRGLRRGGSPGLTPASGREERRRSRSPRRGLPSAGRSSEVALHGADESPERRDGLRSTPSASLPVRRPQLGATQWRPGNACRSIRAAGPLPSSARPCCSPS